VTPADAPLALMAAGALAAVVAVGAALAVRRSPAPGLWVEVETWAPVAAVFATAMALLLAVAS
jgi:uncharacterized protein (DUF983 family)